MNYRKIATTIFAAILAVPLAAGVASATVIFTSTSTSSVTGHNLTFEADFTLSGGTLTLVLKNNSTDAPNNPADALSGFFFDIFNASHIAPTLTYVSATAPTWNASTNPDTLVSAAANVKATVSGDESWAFKVENEACTPGFHFGLSTAGYSSFNTGCASNGFNGSIVGGLEFSLVTDTEIVSANLSNGGVQPLTKGQITFVFNGLSGFTEDDFGDSVLFATGTNPDLTRTSLLCGVTAPCAIAAPEPHSLGVIGTGLSLVGFTFWRRRQRA